MKLTTSTTLFAFQIESKFSSFLFQIRASLFVSDRSGYSLFSGSHFSLTFSLWLVDACHWTTTTQEAHRLDLSQKARQFAGSSFQKDSRQPHNLFFRATPCFVCVSVCLSVCPSVYLSQASIVSKRLNIESRKQRHSDYSVKSDQTDDTSPQKGRGYGHVTN